MQIVRVRAPLRRPDPGCCHTEAQDRERAERDDVRQEVVDTDVRSEEDEQWPAHEESNDVGCREEREPCRPASSGAPVGKDEPVGERVVPEARDEGSTGCTDQIVELAEFDQTQECQGVHDETRRADSRETSEASAFLAESQSR